MKENDFFIQSLNLNILFSDYIRPGVSFGGGGDASNKYKWNPGGGATSQTDPSDLM